MKVGKNRENQLHFEGQHLLSAKFSEANFAESFSFVTAEK